MDGTQNFTFGKHGLYGKQAYAVPYRDISAVVSNVPFKELQADADGITAHQMVVEESRLQSTSIPVRFGILFKSDENVKQMLTKSYKELKSKIDSLRGKDEFGLKIIIEDSNLRNFSETAQANAEIRKIKKEMKSAGDGTAYFLKMRMDEAVRNETFKRIEMISTEIHSEIKAFSENSNLLRSDFDQIVLNAAYLIARDQIPRFQKKIEDMRNRYKKEGLIFHLSGPWAPYSFC